MNYKVTRYENYGQGYIKAFAYKASDKEGKSLVKTLEERGFKRVNGSGIIGLSFESAKSFGKVQITIERVVSMFNPGDKLKCINEALNVFIEKDEIVEFVEEFEDEEKTERFDIKVKGKSTYQNASSKNFVKVVD